MDDQTKNLIQSHIAKNPITPKLITPAYPQEIFTPIVMIAEMIHILRITKLTDHPWIKPTKINKKVIIDIAVHSYLSNRIRVPFL